MEIIRPTCLTSPWRENGHAASRQAQHSGSQALGSGRERVTDRIGSLLRNSGALRTHASTHRTGWTQLRSGVAASWNGTSAAQDLSGPIEKRSDFQPSSSLRCAWPWLREMPLAFGTHREARRPAACVGGPWSHHSAGTCGECCIQNSHAIPVERRNCHEGSCCSNARVGW